MLLWGTWVHILYAQAVKLGCLFRHVEHLYEHVEHLFGIGYTLVLAILIINLNFNYFTCVVVRVGQVFSTLQSI